MNSPNSEKISINSDPVRPYLQTPDCIEDGRIVRKLYTIIYSGFKTEHPSLDFADYERIVSYKDFFNYLHPLVAKFKKSDNQSEIVPHALGFIAPLVSRIGIGTVAGGAASVYNIAKGSFPGLVSDMEGKAYDTLDKTISDIASNIGEAMASNIKGMAGKDIFSPLGRGGRGAGFPTNDTGGISVVGPVSSYYHHEPVKNTLNFNLGIEESTQNAEPFWDSTDDQTCFVGKFNMFSIPNDDDIIDTYYRDVLIPVLRNSVNANKRYAADIATFFTVDLFKKYINSMIQAIATYNFFANAYAYCNEPGLVNNNAALRYLRQELFSTVQLQRFQQLEQLIDSLPFPQTLANSIAQYHGWYSNSEASGATIYCNVPHGIFEDNGATTLGEGEQSCLELKSDVILGLIEDMTSPTTLGDTNVHIQKFLGLLLNVIPGWRTSACGGSAFQTDLCDTDHWNEFINSPMMIEKIVNPGNIAEETTRYASPQYISDSTDLKYATVGTGYNGYLQGYWTPVSFSSSGAVNAFGLVKPQLRLCSDRNIAPHNYYTDTHSNVIVFTHGAMKNGSDQSVTRGFTTWPNFHTQNLGSNIGSFIGIYQDDGIRPVTNVTPSIINWSQRPFGSTYLTNMSVVQCTPNRLLVIQKWLDVQEFYSNISSDKSSSGGRKSRSKSRGKFDKTDETAVDATAK